MQEKILDKIEDIVLCDPEAFARRAAVHTMIELSDIDPRRSTVVISKLTNDMDWEVKMAALGFWEKEVSSKLFKCSNLPSYAVDVEDQNGVKRKADEKEKDLKSLQQMCDCRCANALMIYVTDPDKKVKLKACQLLNLVKENALDNIEPKKLKEDLTKSNGDTGHAATIQINLHNSLTVDFFVQWLKEQDLTKLEIEASRSIDEYADNPGSLLEDILLSVGVDNSVEGEEDNAASVDCY